MLAPVLPGLVACDVVEVEVTAAMAMELLDEIRRLEQDLADVQADTFEAEERASRYADDRDTLASSIEFVGHVVHEMALSARTEIRRSIEEEPPQAVAHQFVETPRETDTELRAIGVAVEADDEPVARWFEPASTAAAPWPPLPQSIVAGTTWTVDEADLVVFDVPADADFTPEAADRAPVAETADAEGEATEELAFEAFWREHNDAADARSNALAPLEILAPMAVLLFMLFIVLSLI